MRRWSVYALASKRARFLFSFWRFRFSLLFELRPERSGDGTSDNKEVGLEAGLMGALGSNFKLDMAAASEDKVPGELREMVDVTTDENGLTPAISSEAWPPWALAVAFCLCPEDVEASE